MSPPENNLKNRVNCILLCAGEGKRISDQFPDIPKSLISINEINNKSILLDILHKLYIINPSKVFIIVGYLKEKIKEFFAHLQNTDTKLTQKILLVDSELEYKKGPLYSLLSIMQNKNFELSSNYLLLPGDTIFHNNLINEINNHLEDFVNQSAVICELFYQKIKGNIIRDRFKSLSGNLKVKLSIAKIQKKEKTTYLRKIITRNASRIRSKKNILLLIPCFLFKNDFLHQVRKSSINTKFKTLRDVTNLLIEKGIKISLIELNSEFEFYDIDTYQDLKFLKKKVDNSSSDILRIYDSKS